jgi:HEAT repeat protein
MRDDDQKVALLSTKLSSENKLYTKIELCDALAKMGICAVKTMSEYLGRIGNNQYTKLPEEEFKKKSYPLPRDIISRTLAHMGKEVLPYLLEVLMTKDNLAIREVIDAIGFICFYEKIDYPLKDLITCFNINSDDRLIRWKVVRALGSSSNGAAIDLLTKIKNSDNEGRIRKEAERSLRIIQQRKTAFV